MRWVVDECVSAKLIVELRANGHDVLSIAEIQPRSKDVSILDLSVRENRILLTDDRNFGELIFGPYGSAGTLSS